MKSQIIDLKRYSKNTIKISIENNFKNLFAGQCFSLGIPGMGINREYSIYSGEKDNHVDFLIRILNDGVLTSKLNQLNINDEIEISGPFGEFILNSEIKKKYLFIATGTGIAPFHSFIKTFKDLDYFLLHGIRTSSDKYDYDEYDKNKIDFCISRDKGVTKFTRVTEYLKTLKIEKFNEIYLCGNRHMISDCTEIINHQKPDSVIMTEVFF